MKVAVNQLISQINMARGNDTVCCLLSVAKGVTLNLSAGFEW